LERVCHECKHFLILVEQQAGGQVAQSFVGEAWGSQELQTLDLSEMCSLAQREEVEQFCDIVPPAL
jgi:hypothetical protein